MSQCQATTKAGTQCKKAAREGRVSCNTHDEFDRNHMMMASDPDIGPFLAGPPSFASAAKKLYEASKEAAEALTGFHRAVRESYEAEAEILKTHFNRPPMGRRPRKKVR